MSYPIMAYYMDLAIYAIRAADQTYAV